MTELVLERWTSEDLPRGSRLEAYVSATGFFLATFVIQLHVPAIVQSYAPNVVQVSRFVSQQMPDAVARGAYPRRFRISRMNFH